MTELQMLHAILTWSWLTPPIVWALMTVTAVAIAGGVMMWATKDMNWVIGMAAATTAAWIWAAPEPPSPLIAQVARLEYRLTQSEQMVQHLFRALREASKPPQPRRGNKYSRPKNERNI